MGQKPRFLAHKVLFLQIKEIRGVESFRRLLSSSHSISVLSFFPLIGALVISFSSAVWIALGLLDSSLLVDRYFSSHVRDIRTYLTAVHYCSRID